MICSKIFLDELVKSGFTSFYGVPCSFMTPLIKEILERRELKYYAVSSEGEALAMSSGAWLANKPSVVMLQNSGLGNIVNPLTSLCHPFKIPTLLLITWRGEPGIKDEPQHCMMGKILLNLLDLMEISWIILPEDRDQLSSSLALIKAQMLKKKLPFAIILKKNSLNPETSELPYYPRSKLLSRYEVLSILISVIPKEAALIATTGKTGRELFTISDCAQYLYCVGSMGYANALAHGLAQEKDRLIYVLDGDGATLMHLGNLATIGAYSPKNLVHIVLDNGTYDSTGGQATISQHINFIEMAKALGYKTTVQCKTQNDIALALSNNGQSQEGPVFIHIPILPGSRKNLGRPTIKPEEVSQRLKMYLTEME